MKKYDDKSNLAGMKIIFMVAQMFILLVVYAIIYTSFLAIQYAVNLYGVSQIMYFPVFVALVIFPILLYKYRQMFNAGNMLVATVWTMGAASLVIILLYVYVAQVTS